MLKNVRELHLPSSSFKQYSRKIKPDPKVAYKCRPYSLQHLSRRACPSAYVTSTTVVAENNQNTNLLRKTDQLFCQAYCSSIKLSPNSALVQYLATEYIR